MLGFKPSDVYAVIGAYKFQFTNAFVCEYIYKKTSPFRIQYLKIDT